jgi:predicted AAA+ superfamily ATPase
MSHAKFYFFDLGVRNHLANIISLEPQSDLYGHAFEHFIAMELQAYLSYARKKLPLSYWRTVQGDEVDFIIGDDVAIEVKTHSIIREKHLKGLKKLQEEKICKKYILISFEKIHRIQDNIEILYWEYFLDQLWAGRIIV